MPPFTVNILAVAGLLVASVFGAALTAEKSFMRSEVSMQLDITPSGTMHTASEKKFNLQTSSASTEAASSTADDNQDDSTAETDMCDVDYPLGKDPCTCAEKDHLPILQEEMCIQAAAEAGVVAPPGVFRLGSEFFHKRPKGCFKFPCSEDPKGICYFFNPIGNDPGKCGNTTDPAAPEVEGTPVCKRAKFLNGTVDGNGGCPEGYQVIMNENNCSEAGICLGFCEGSEFRTAVMNESKHDEYPLGCFIHKTEGCVYFNRPLAGYGLPKRPQGTPICNVSTITHFPPKVG